ncbi:MULTISPECIES: hypothetical protein [unclassified Yoonia]|uniref:hypothetical protein n=1 Tax=unclassified Yoonia TaxID=2629118 RepID=UPI002AFE1BD6|nr:MULTISPECIES: hypothetical protein [unclassified Yoonia]
MPFEKLTVILLVVIAAAGVTVWIALSLVSGTSLSPFVGLSLLSIAALLAAVLVRRLS